MPGLFGCVAPGMAAARLGDLYERMTQAMAVHLPSLLFRLLTLATWGEEDDG